MNQSERIPLHRGDMLELVFQGLGGQTYIQRAEVEEMIGEGASCLSYIVRLHTSESSSTRMIMKEFYPCDTELEPGIRREGGRLQVAEETKKERAYIEKLEAFHRSFDLQNRLADSEAMEVMVRPYPERHASWNDPFTGPGSVSGGEAVDHIQDSGGGVSSERAGISVHGPEPE